MGLPSGYRQLEYIETSGTQYINTGFYPNQNTRVVMRYRLTNLNSTWQGIFSGRDGPSAGYGNNFSLWANASGNYRTDFGPDNGPTFGTLDTNEHTADKNKQITTIGSETASNDAATFTCNYPLHLATGYTGGAAEYPASMRIYSCQIYDDAILVRDYIPALRASDSVPGLYDLSNDVFYTNAGSGSFIYVLPTAKHGTLAGGTAYAVTGGRVLVEGTGYSITKGRTMAGGTLYDIPFSSGKALAEYAEEDIVYLSEGGVLVPFYVACHNYESVLNGSGRTLVVRKDCYDTRAWHSYRVNAYASSTIDAWLNGDYKALLDADIQSVIGTTKFYYTPGCGNNTVTTLERAIFLLSVTELGKTAAYAKVEGTALPIASTLQIAYRNGSAVTQWTRSPNTGDNSTACYLQANGNIDNYYCTTAFGSRPAFTLPDTVKFDLDTNEFISA